MNLTLFKKCIYEFNPVQERQVYSRNTYMNLTLFKKYKYESNLVQEINVWITLFMKYMYEFNLVQGMHEWITLFMKYKSEHKEIIKAYLFSISISTTIYITLQLNCHINSNKFNHQSNLFGPTNPTILCFPEPRFLKQSRREVL